MTNLSFRGISKVESLKVGVFIEETDIDELNAAIAVTTHDDINRVYGNLFAGFLNRFAAFKSHLAKY